MVREIIIDMKAISLEYQFHPPFNTLKFAQRFNGHFWNDTSMSRCCHSGECVVHIVNSGQGPLHGTNFSPFNFNFKFTGIIN